MVQAVISLYSMIDRVAACTDDGEHTQQEQNKRGELDVLAKFERREARHVDVKQSANQQRQLGHCRAARDESQEQHGATGEVRWYDVVGYGEDSNRHVVVFEKAPKFLLIVHDVEPLDE